MAHPKRRQSHARTAKRRAQYKITNLPVTQECPSCGNPKVLHRACPTCGEYRGRSILARTDVA